MKIISINVCYGTNCYLLCSEADGVCAVIDPGGDERRIISAAEQSGCAPAVILLTHGHYDHVAGVRGLRVLWPDIPVYLNRRDIFAGDSDRQLLRLFPPVDGTVDYDEGDTVSVGSVAVKVLATPGHSGGSVSLIAGDALFCGDTLFASSMGRTDLPGGSDAQMTASLARLGALPGDLRVLPGHMGASTLNAERGRNPYLIAAMRAAEAER